MLPIYRTPQSKPLLMQEYSKILRRWPEPNEQRIVPTDNGETFVISSGAGEGTPLLLLHGSTTNAALWLYDVAKLGETRRVHAVDIIGEPGRSADVRPGFEDGAYARWLSQVLDGLGVDQAAVAGNSMGGWLALELATRMPKRVSALVLLAPAGIAPVCRTFFVRMLPKVLVGKRGAQSLNHLLFGNARIPEEVFGYAELLRRHYNPRPLKFPIFTDEAISALKMPVLFIAGEEDPLLSTQKGAARLRRLLPQADVRTLPGLAHAITDRAKDITEFLDRQGI
jgi:pimeloyl-ACP methyl ester carboxylesterase